jgi:hypothetical protein
VSQKAKEMDEIDVIHNDFIGLLENSFAVSDSPRAYSSV